MAATAMACAGPARDAAPPSPVAVPAPPTAASAEPAAPSSHDDRGPPERQRLEAACFATPWVAKDASAAAKPLDAATAERLEVLERECLDTHPELGPGRFATPTQIPPSECHYGIARIYFEQRHFVEAARWFHRVAVEHADLDIGVYAAQLYLESLNVLWAQSSPERLECRQLLLEDAAHFACVYCARTSDPESCRIFRRVGAELEPGQSESCAPR